MVDTADILSSVFCALLKKQPIQVVLSRNTVNTEFQQAFLVGLDAQ